VVEEKEGDRTVRVASYGGGKERASRQLGNNLYAAVDFYQQLFGIDYPFPEVLVLEINAWGFGVAPAGMIFITREAYDPIGHVRNRFFSEGVNERYVHEVAHGFWGHVSRAASAEEAWLNESFAEYSAALCLQGVLGGKAGEREFNKLLREWVSLSKQIGDGASLYLAQRLSAKEGDDSAARDYAYLVYARGPLVLHALRQELARRQGGPEQGDRYFFALLRAFLQHVESGWGETRHLVGILNQITGSDWQPGFELNYYGTEAPEVKL
jgi:aminopeptidase N